MANLCIKVIIGKMEANEKGREYKFSIGKPDSKIDNETVLNIIEEAIEEKMTSMFGYAGEPHGG